jgi:hypothetical protein
MSPVLFFFDFFFFFELLRFELGVYILSLFWAHAYNPSYSAGRDQENCDSQPAFISKTPNPEERTGGVAQVAQSLPSKHEVLSSSTRKKIRGPGGS